MDKRIFPTLDINHSATRKEELLVPGDVLNKSWILRGLMSPLSDSEQMEFMLGKMRQTKTNREFLDMMSS